LFPNRVISGLAVICLNQTMHTNSMYILSLAFSYITLFVTATVDLFLFIRLTTVYHTFGIMLCTLCSKVHKWLLLDWRKHCLAWGEHCWHYTKQTLHKSLLSCRIHRHGLLPGGKIFHNYICLINDHSLKRVILERQMK